MSDIKIAHFNGLIVVMTGRGEKPFLKYEILRPLGVMRILSTYVPEEMRGRGLAEVLVKEAIKLAKSESLKIEPFCSYAAYFFYKHREERDVLVEWLREKSDEDFERIVEYLRAREGT